MVLHEENDDGPYVIPWALDARDSKLEQFHDDEPMHWQKVDLQKTF